MTAITTFQIKAKGQKEEQARIQLRQNELRTAVESKTRDEQPTSLHPRPPSPLPSPQKNRMIGQNIRNYVRFALEANHCLQLVPPKVECTNFSLS